LGYDADFSNILHHKDGILTGLVGGDGANDKSMFEHADRGRCIKSI